jgi:hypothetical protein
VPTKPPSDRMHAKGVFPMINPHFQCGMHPIPQKIRNEPNSTPAAHRLRKTNPISAFPPTRRGVLCKTNPICHATTLPAPLNFAKRTQSHPRGTPNMRNEPNLTPATSSPRWPKVSPDLSGSPIHPHRHLVPPQKIETNPI